MTPNPPKTNTLQLIAEIFALILTFLLPWKFASIIGVPEFPGTYCSDLPGLFFTTWPLPIFQFGAFLLLFLTAAARIFCRNDFCRPQWTRRGWYLAWMFLPIAALAGFRNASCLEYAVQMGCYAFAVSAYAISIHDLLRMRRGFAKPLLTAILCGTCVEIYSGLYQYFYGFKELQAFMQEQIRKYGENAIVGNLKNRIMEERVQADFTVCNTFAGYLAMILPILLTLSWKFGNERVQPEKTSRWILPIPIASLVLFLIFASGSRGAIFSLLAGAAVLFLFLKLPGKIRITGVILLLAGVCLFLWVVLAGRGFKSMFFRWDYNRCAFQMLLDHPFFGTGWGDFFHDYPLLKHLYNEEAPHTPHNVVMMFASQAGIFAGCIAMITLILPCVSGLRYVLKNKLQDLEPGKIALLLAVLIGAAETMLEVTYESPAFIGTWAALAAILLADDRKDDGVDAEKRVKFRLAVPANLLLAGISLICAVYAIRAEAALSELVFTLDARYSASARPLPPPDAIHRLFLRAKERNPFSPTPFSAMADYERSRGNPDAGIQYINQAILLSPEQGSLYLKRARFRYGQSDPVVTDEIHRDLDWVRKRSPMNPNYHCTDKQMLGAEPFEHD